MIIAVDETGLVRLVADGDDPASVPKNWNGLKLTVHVLTKEREEAYRELPADRAGAKFNGASFETIAVEVAPESPAVATLDDVIATMDASQKARLDLLLAAKKERDAKTGRLR